MHIFSQMISYDVAQRMKCTLVTIHFSFSGKPGRTVQLYRLKYSDILIHVSQCYYSGHCVKGPSGLFCLVVVTQNMYLFSFI